MRSDEDVVTEPGDDADIWVGQPANLSFFLSFIELRRGGEAGRRAGWIQRGQSQKQ